MSLQHESIYLQPIKAILLSEFANIFSNRLLDNVIYAELEVNLVHGRRGCRILRRRIITLSPLPLRASSRSLVESQSQCAEEVTGRHRIPM